MKKEHILAVDADIFDKTEAEKARVFPDIDVCCSNADLVVLQRDRAETDLRYRHIIPYTVLRNEHGQILLYQRGSGAGEQRLAGSRSVGFGGHVDLHDIRYEDSVINLEATLEDAAFRELREELAVHKNAITRVTERGIILDDSNEVGLVHVGQLLVADYAGRYQQVKSQEEELSIVGWRKPEEINLDDLEPWSCAVVSYLKGDVEVVEEEVDTEEVMQKVDAFAEAVGIGTKPDQPWYKRWWAAVAAL